MPDTPSHRHRATAVERAASLWLDHLRVERGLAANTTAAYRRDLRKYTAFLSVRGIGDLGAVREADVLDFAAALRDEPGGAPAATSSVGRALVTVRGFHAFAVREGWTDADPASEVQPPAPPSRLPKALTVEQVTRLLEAVPTPTSEPDAGTAGAGAESGPGDPAAKALALRDRALLEFLYGTGARVSEATGLDVDDLDLAEGSVLLRGKGDKERVVPLGRYAVAHLGAYLVRGRPVLTAARAQTRSRAARSVTSARAVFLNTRGARLSRQLAWNVIKGAAVRAGLSADVGPHTLRHSYATHVLDGGADLRVVQELLGHASVTTTQIYTKVSLSRLKEVYAGAHPRAREG